MFLMCLLLLAIVSLILLHDCIKKNSYKWKRLSDFPGDPTLPLIGNVLQLGFVADDISCQLLAMWKRHGMKNFRFSIGSNDWIMLSNAEDVKTLLNHTTELKKPLLRNKAMDPFFGNSISSSEGLRWKLTRKLMSSSLGNNKLDGNVDFVNNYCKQLFRHLDNLMEKDVEVYKYLRPYTFDILTETLLGVESNLMNDLDNTYLYESGKTIEILTENMFSYWRHISPIFMLTPMYREMLNSVSALRSNSMEIINKRREKLQQLGDDLIYSERRKIYESKSTKKLLQDSGCLLDNLLLCQKYNGGSFSDEILCDEITLISFAGHYTMAMTISHTLYCISKYPEIQKKLLDEQKFVLKNNMTSDPDVYNLNEMKYLDAVIKETMRFFPTVTKIGRELQNDLRLQDGRVAPAGSIVTVFYKALYSNAEIYPEPDKFHPERFLEPIHRYGFVPFSTGPRSCIGFRFAWMTMKATLSNLLRRYEILPGGPGTEPQFVSRVVTESKNGVHLRLRRRN